jgi:hypothetical protein
MPLMRCVESIRLPSGLGNPLAPISVTINVDI